MLRTESVVLYLLTVTGIANVRQGKQKKTSCFCDRGRHAKTYCIERELTIDLDADTDESTELDSQREHERRAEHREDFS